MRKADYSTLARILKDNIESGEYWAKHGESETLKRMAEEQAMTARRIAHEFAKTANVDEKKFLVACAARTEAS